MFIGYFSNYHSPFLRGIGAIELLLSVFLCSTAWNIAAISVTMTYRFFEFWAPLLICMLTFLFKTDNLVLSTLVLRKCFFKELTNNGMPVVMLDALKYFWIERTSNESGSGCLYLRFGRTSRR